MNQINYTELYGVKPDETDFSGAIQRWKESGMKVGHLDKFTEMILKYIKI